MMPLIGVTGLLAAGLMAGKAGAQVATLGLRPGEVALHIVARGETTTAADRIMVPVRVNGRGPTNAAARAAAEATATQLIASLVAAGVDRASIVTQPPPTRFGIERAAAALTNMADTGRSGGRLYNETVTIEVTVANAAGIDRVLQVLSTQQQVDIETPVPSLRDDTVARRGAVSAAVSRARHEAEDYAAPLGLQVVRVAAVSNAAGLTDGIEELAATFNSLRNGSKTPDTVVTHATAVVDYVLAPR